MDRFFRQLADDPFLRDFDWQFAAGHLLLAFVLGQLVAWTYVKTHSDLTYSRSQVQSLVLLSMIVATVMMAIGNNLARAFGLFGALALIRFRTPVKDARDTTFLFLSVGVGIAVGAGMATMAVLSTVFLCAVAWYLYTIRFGERVDHNAVLRFSMPAEAEQEQLLRRILTHYCRTFALVFLRDTGLSERMEFSYQIDLRDKGAHAELVADLRDVPGIEGVNLLMQNEDVEL